MQWLQFRWDLSQEGLAALRGQPAPISARLSEALQCGAKEYEEECGKREELRDASKLRRLRVRLLELAITQIAVRSEPAMSQAAAGPLSASELAVRPASAARPPPLTLSIAPLLLPAV